jgi:hypothetical protein
MFQILRSPSITPGSQVFQEDIAAAVEKNDEGFNELGRRHSRGPTAYYIHGWLDVPCPTPISKCAHPSAKSEQAVSEENSTFDKVCQDIEYGASVLFTLVSLGT